MDVISFLPEFAPGGVRLGDFSSRCSAFLKRVGSEVILTHNTWSVKNRQIAKNVITYTDPTNPLSIFGRWDLGYGVTDYPKQIPDGALDAKVGSADMVRSFMELSGCPTGWTANLRGCLYI